MIIILFMKTRKKEKMGFTFCKEKKKSKKNYLDDSI